MVAGLIRGQTTSSQMARYLKAKKEQRERKETGAKVKVIRKSNSGGGRSRIDYSSPAKNNFLESDVFKSSLAESQKRKTTSVSKDNFLKSDVFKSSLQKSETPSTSKKPFIKDSSDKDMFGGLEVRAVPKKNIFQKAGSKIKFFGEEFLSGVSLQKPNETASSIVAGGDFTAQAGLLFRSAGYGVSIVGSGFGLKGASSVASKAGQAVQGVKTSVTASKFGQTALKTQQALQATRLGRFGLGVGRTAVQTGGAVIKGGLLVEGGSQVGTLTLSKEDKNLIKEFNINQALKSGFQKSSEQETWYKGFATELPYGSQLVDEQKMRQGIRENLKKQGLSGEKLKKAEDLTYRQGLFRSGGELAGLLEISRTSESIGRKQVAESFARKAQKGVTFESKKSFKKLFGASFLPIARAGFVEGVASETTQQVSRVQDANLKKAGLMGGFGFGSAGLIGGSIVGLSQKAPGASRAIELGTYISDPLEKPGDLLQDVAERISGKSFTRAGLKRVGVQGVGSKADDILRFATVKTPTPVNVFSSAKTKTSIKKGSNIFSPSNIFSSVNTNINQPTDFLGDTIINPFTPTPVKTPTPIDIPIFSPGVPTPSVPSPGVPTPTNIMTDTQTDVPVNVPVNVPINVPIGVPLMRVPPPLPFFPGFDFSGSGSGRGGRRKSSRFVNELSVGLGFLKQQGIGNKGFSLGLGNSFNAPKIKKTTRKKSSRKKNNKRKGLIPKMNFNNNNLFDSKGRIRIF